MSLYWMFREDGRGDSGPMCQFYSYDGSSGTFQRDDNITKPIVGAIVRVGSLFSRSFASQDYWTTTEILEILEEKELEDGRLYVKFKTKNSVYEWKGPLMGG